MLRKPYSPRTLHGGTGEIQAAELYSDYMHDVFIVSTNSPFVLSSLDNVVIYDLENRTLVRQPQGLTDIPYEGIVEGYFGADSLSDKLREKCERFNELVKKENLNYDELREISSLELFLDEIPDYLALNITTEYQSLKSEFYAQEVE